MFYDYLKFGHELNKLSLHFTFFIHFQINLLIMLSLKA